MTAHALGLGPPVGLYAARDRLAFPWTRGWRDGGWLPVAAGATQATRGGFFGSGCFATSDVPKSEDVERADDEAHDGFSREYFMSLIHI